MPTSAVENKNIAKDWIDTLNPKHVLDIGVGKGTYSDLARTPEQTWIGIEAYYPYVQEFDLDGKYDDIIIGDARYIDYNKLPKQDLIIIGDMIEHMEKQQAKDLLTELLDHTRHILICFPVQHLDQHDDRNPFEDHIDHWDYEEMNNFMNGKVKKSLMGDILAYFLIGGKYE